MSFGWNSITKTRKEANEDVRIVGWVPLIFSKMVIIVIGVGVYHIRLRQIRVETVVCKYLLNFLTKNYVHYYMYKCTNDYMNNLIYMRKIINYC